VNSIKSEHQVQLPVVDGVYYVIKSRLLSLLLHKELALCYEKIFSLKIVFFVGVEDLQRNAVTRYVQQEQPSWLTGPGFPFFLLLLVIAVSEGR